MRPESAQYSGACSQGAPKARASTRLQAAFCHGVFETKFFPVPLDVLKDGLCRPVWPLTTVFLLIIFCGSLVFS